MTTIIQGTNILVKISLGLYSGNMSGTFINTSEN